MIKNYIKIAWRNLVKNRSFSFLNIAGLSIGISTCFIIMLFVQEELSFDRFNENADRIVRVVFKANINGGKIFEANVMPPVARVMKNDYPEVQDATRLRKEGALKVTYKDKSFKEEEMAFVDPNFFSIFTLPLIRGDAKTALSEPFTLIITKKLAVKYFGKEDPIGKSLFLNGDKNVAYKVTGLIDRVPSNSHFRFDMFVSMLGLEDAKSNTWMGSNFFTYLLLKKGTNYKKLEAKLPGMVEQYMGPQIQQTMGISLDQFVTKGNQLGFGLQPLTSIHLQSQANYELSPPGNRTYVYVFGLIALFMLLIACINFINLSTASASKRAKEVGIRKVIGGGQSSLIKQFLTESFILVEIACIISVVLIQFVLPTFNNISGKNLLFDFNLKMISAFIGLGLIVSIIAGLYPAIFLSSYKPIDVLKGNKTGNNRSLGLRSGLVVFQFFISVVLIIGTFVVWQQMNYIQNRHLGYNKEQLLTIPNSYALGKNEAVYKQQILRDQRVVNATTSSYKPAGPSSGGNALTYPEGRDHEIMRTQEYHVDEHYIPTFEMKMAAGRNFSKEFSTDSTGIIINETAARAFGWNALSATGEILIRQNSTRGRDIPYHVIGVVKDFNFQSLHEPIRPLLMTLAPDAGLIIRVKTADIRGLLSTMKEQWSKFKTGENFTYSFMDDLYNKTYAAEQKTGTILNIFAALTIFVSCLGLFGLAIYTAEQRTKEIGIRKVLGASVTQVTKMLSTDFLKLVLIASLLAFPIAWWAMYEWLQSFAYRINISWWVFLIAGLVTILIAVFTVGFQAIKAAMANPAESLRTE